MASRLWISGIVMVASFLITTAADAQIKTLIMPGDLIQGHADIEQDCDKCHQKFERGKQRVLCLDCHDDIAQDIDAHAGFHGLSDKAREDSCKSCHTDHVGRDADIVHLNKRTFDHTLTDFALLGAPTTPINWREGIFESVAVLLLGAGTLTWTYRALTRIRYLEGLVLICMDCRRVHTQGRWIPLEVYVIDHSEAILSHSVCPECKEKHYAKVLK